MIRDAEVTMPLAFSYQATGVQYQHLVIERIRTWIPAGLPAVLLGCSRPDAGKKGDGLESCSDEWNQDIVPRVT